MSELPTDAELNAIGVLKRRLIEARVLAPMLAAMSREFGAERVQAIAREVIRELAEAQGQQLADYAGGCSLAHFAGTLDKWTADEALTIDVVEQTSERFAFNVTRCRYAEMYRTLGVPELGAVFSCQRDGALMAGFNPDVEFTRTQTIMGGASHCDFVYALRRGPAQG